jgi:hypothetical protein
VSQRVLFCGDRNWSDREIVRREMLALHAAWPDVVICHGAARGADSLAGEEAAKLGIPVTAFPADWKKYGRGAGPIRNRQMLKEFAPTMVIALHDDLKASKGTKDMVTMARQALIPTVVRSHQGETK